MGTFPNSTRRFWLAVFTAAATLLGALVAVGTSTAYVRHSWNVLSEARRELEALELHRHGVTRASRELRQLEPEIAAIRGSFANPADPLPFIEAIEELGRQRGVSVELTVSGGVSEEYRLSASGSFASVLSFLHAVELLPFHVAVGDTEMVRSGTTSGDRSNLQPREVIRLSVTLRMVPLP